MKIIKLLCCITLCCAITSCIKDEAPNTEADIVSCTVAGDLLKREPQVENEKVIILPKAAVDVTAFPVEFTLTPGATIDPPSGTPRDFTTPQTYTVTSEDGEWKKTYTVYCSVSEIRIKYDFENFELTPSGNYSYYTFYEKTEIEDQYFWSSGNPLAVILFGSQGPDSFPTIASEEGKSGYCAKLETKSTGFLGGLMKKYIAAGNLFIGEFIFAIAQSDPLGATRFGTPFTKVPLNVTGYYKYKAGPKYIDKNGKEVVGKKDEFDIYAILYETDDEVQYLDGNDSLTSPNLISIARIKDEDKTETDEWTYFDLPFDLLPDKKIDPYKLMTSKYNISLVFSSSIDGALFKGAAGSTLMIDEVEIHCID